MTRRMSQLSTCLTVLVFGLAITSGQPISYTPHPQPAKGLIDAGGTYYGGKYFAAMDLPTSKVGYYATPETTGVTASIFDDANPVIPAGEHAVMPFSKPDGLYVLTTSSKGSPSSSLKYDWTTRQLIRQFGIGDSLSVQLSAASSPIQATLQFASSGFKQADGNEYALAWIGDASGKLINQGFLQTNSKPWKMLTAISDVPDFTVGYYWDGLGVTYFPKVSPPTGLVRYDTAGKRTQPLYNGVVVADETMVIDSTFFCELDQVTGEFLCRVKNAAGNFRIVRVGKKSNDVIWKSEDMHIPAPVGFGSFSFYQGQISMIIGTGAGKLSSWLVYNVATGVTQTIVREGLLPNGQFDGSVAVGLSPSGCGATIFADSGIWDASWSCDLPSIDRVVNAGDFTTNIAPSTWTSTFGKNFGTQETASTWSLTTGGAQVTFCGIGALSNYNDPGQHNALVPEGVRGNKTCQVVITVNGVSSKPFTVPILDEYWGVFSTNVSDITMEDNPSMNIPIATHADGSLVGPAGFATGKAPREESANTSPAQMGEVIVAWATGCNPAGSNPAVAVGGLKAKVVYAGNSGGPTTGLCQLNFIVPNGLQPGDNNDLVVNGTDFGPLSVQ